MARIVDDSSTSSVEDAHNDIYEREKSNHIRKTFFLGGVGGCFLWKKINFFFFFAKSKCFVYFTTIATAAHTCSNGPCLMS